MIGWTRPFSDILGLELAAQKRPVGSAPMPAKEAQRDRAQTGSCQGNSKIFSHLGLDPQPLPKGRARVLIHGRGCV
jgi:hypothetical protein